jgi:hypothetical protein
LGQLTAYEERGDAHGARALRDLVRLLARQAARELHAESLAASCDPLPIAKKEHGNDAGA